MRYHHKLWLDDNFYVQLFQQLELFSLYYFDFLLINEYLRAGHALQEYLKNRSKQKQLVLIKSHLIDIKDTYFSSRPRLEIRTRQCAAVSTETKATCLYSMPYMSSNQRNNSSHTKFFTNYSTTTNMDQFSIFIRGKN